jgi:hypothetical protein
MRFSVRRALSSVPIFPTYFSLILSALTLWFLRLLHSQVGTVLGLRGTGDWSTDERPKNYREEILLLFPNSPVSLTALMSKLKSENTTDPEFKIFTKQLPVQRAQGTGSQTSTTTTINLTGSGTGKIFKKGHAVLVERTLEVMWVTADPTTPFNLITVSRGKGSTAAALNDLDGLLIVGSHHQEGAPVPTSVTYDPTMINNFTQIFRNSLFLTNTARATKIRTGSDMLERQRETLEIHAIEREMAYLFGTGVEDTSGAEPERTTKGVLSLITTNVKDFAGSVDVDSWELFLEGCFTDGSNEKLCLAGNSAITVINKIARIHGMIQMTPRTDAFGMSLQTYVTPYGDLQVRQHALLSKNATFKSWGFVIDPQYLVDRALSGNGVNRDTNYYENRQSQGDDTTKDEWLTESGLELQFESVNGVFKNATGFVP